MNQVTGVRHYFVDEAGDSTLFDGKGKVIIETPGCSRFFILGLLDVTDHDGLRSTFSALHDQLLHDPYFKDVPSMQSSARKTAIAFHAKHDLPEVRREVFTLLHGTEGLRFFAVVTDKLRGLEYVVQQNERIRTYRYLPDGL